MAGWRVGPLCDRAAEEPARLAGTDNGGVGWEATEDLWRGIVRFLFRVSVSRHM